MGRQINIGIIGIGRWGINYLRTFNELENAEVKWICATKKATLKEASAKLKLNSNIKATINYGDILKDKDIKAVAIVTPGSTHYQLAKKALLADKHVLVEKPLALSSQDVKKLIKISEKKNKFLMVGHLHIFNPGIQKLKADIDNGLLGKINFMHFSHFGNGPIRSDMGAVWDFFPHTVSILLHILKKSPLIVSANGASYIKNEIEDVATMDMLFPNKIFVTSIASWLYPLKKMDIVVVGEKRYATFDDYAKSDKLKYYDNRPQIADGKVIIKDKGYTAPKFSNVKPLTIQLKHFLDCIENNNAPITDGYDGLKVVSILEAAQKSLRNNGSMVKIKPQSL